MYYYRYAKLRGQRQPYNNKFSASPLHLQHQMPELNQENDLGIPAGWSDPDHPGGLWGPGPEGLASFSSLKHPVNQVGTQVHSAGWMPVNPVGLNTQVYPTGWMSVNPAGFSTQGQMVGWGDLGGPVGWGSYGNPAGWGSQGIPMGWGNFMGQGQPGMFGGLLKVGKGALGGLGTLSNLINVGKMLY
ncbi:hypothetical protein F7731_17890 [Cytobacillus depressus]|uniref:Uncharacterized protein n=1 Tax=Cytobacillus depressus TaxID=1602942 RepID=A0A6L3V1V7_9BACI|nr:hypothetical protein [Cytobacillus depressus]KAB2332158.1 hypothetical protein F7731_17890 [Cytobacillus depressus]